MLKLCEQQQVPIIISSDAHDPSWVGRFDLAVKLLEELQFDESLILTNDIEKLRSIYRRISSDIFARNSGHFLRMLLYGNFTRFFSGCRLLS